MLHTFTAAFAALEVRGHKSRQQESCGKEERPHFEMMEEISGDIAVDDNEERKPRQAAKTFCRLYIGKLDEISIDTRDKDFPFAHSSTAQVERWGQPFYYKDMLSFHEWAIFNGNSFLDPERGCVLAGV
jgi:hypothetical protein